MIRDKIEKRQSKKNSNKKIKNQIGYKKHMK